MGTTANFGFRYPAASDAPDGPGGFYNLASDIDAYLAATARKATTWTAYTPAGATANGITNFGGGNSTSVWFWRYAGGELEVKGSVTLGSSGGAVSGDVTVGLPVSASSPTGQGDLIYTVKLIDAGTNVYVGAAGLATSSSAYIRMPVVASTHLVEQVLSSTNPITWGTGDGLQVRLRYTPTS